jgi:radical SAM superfamily enzyme YgiQ (UPF0313 family)
MTKDYDIVIMNLPWSDLTVPFSAPAVLKGIAESHGYKAKTIDFNVDLYTKFCQSDDAKFKEIQEYYNLYTKERPEVLDRFYDYIIATLKTMNFRYLGISVFYILTQKATYELCTKLRKELPDIKIVLGGKGLNVYGHLSLHPYLDESEKTVKFDKLMAERNLADYFIIGDAEDAIIDLLSGKLDNRPYAISEWFVPSKDDLEYPFANFDDYELDKYVGKEDQVQIPIISSKGCVRRCDFCDVPSQFKKFQSKNGKRMAEEMLFLSEKYNVQKFTMADSIANGNLKSLKEFAEILAEHNRNAPKNKKIRWSSNWIHRPLGQVTEETFRSIAESGAEHFTVGAEHFSDNVLHHMNKKTNMQGLLHELELFRKYKVNCGVNTIIAHWSETYEDFMEHMENLIRLGPFFADGTITYLNAGLFYIMKNTPAVYNGDKTGLVMLSDDFSLSWYTPKNANLTIKPRLARFYFLLYVANYLNYPIWNQKIAFKNYIHRIKESLGDAMELFDKHIKIKDHKPCKIFNMLDQMEDFVEHKLEKLFPGSKLNLNLTANSCKGDPVLYVKHNGIKIYEKKLAQGDHELSLPIKYDYSSMTKLEIGMSGKNKNDTMVDRQGNILRDKNILLNKVELDKIDLLEHPHFWNHRVNFHSDKPAYGFWENGGAVIEFAAPFWRCLQQNQYESEKSKKDKYSFKRGLNQFKEFFTKIKY